MAIESVFAAAAAVIVEFQCCRCHVVVFVCGVAVESVLVVGNVLRTDNDDAYKSCNLLPVLVPLPTLLTLLYSSLLIILAVAAADVLGVVLVLLVLFRHRV